MSRFLKSLVWQISKSNQSLEATRILHGLMITSCLYSDPFYVTKVVALYAANNDLNSSRQLFEETPHRTIYLWNCIIRAHARAQRLHYAAVYFKRLLSSATDPDNRTFACIARACAERLDVNALRNVHSKAIIYGFGTDPICGSTFVRCYSTLGLIGEAKSVFQCIDEPDLVALNAIISGYCSCGDWKNVVNLFGSMQGFRPDGHTMVGLIVGIVQHNFVSLGEMIHCYCMKCGLVFNDHVSSSLVNMYLKFGRIDSALEVFGSLQEPDLVSWSAMITGLSEAGDHTKALMFLSEMLMDGVRPDLVLLASMLSAAAQASVLQPGSEIHGYAVRNGCSGETVISSALVDMYAKCGLLNASMNVFRLMPRRNAVSYNIMISSLGLHGRAAEAFRLFDEMIEEGLEPDKITFSGILSACCHCGLVNESREYFRRMTEEFGIQPKTEHHVYMVKLLGMNGKLRMAYDLIMSLPKPVDSSLWGALLSCCDSHQNYDLLKEIEKHLPENESESCKYRVMLSNVYADGGRWEDVNQLRVEMGGAKGKVAAIARIPG